MQGFQNSFKEHCNLLEQVLVVFIVKYRVQYCKWNEIEGCYIHSTHLMKLANSRCTDVVGRCEQSRKRTKIAEVLWHLAAAYVYSVRVCVFRGELLIVNGLVSPQCVKTVASFSSIFSPDPWIFVRSPRPEAHLQFNMNLPPPTTHHFREAGNSPKDTQWKFPEKPLID
ncbi:hypothetical protein LSTR_LSTR001691 [Laodelphax striatellus]|uniref:Uncharacterized protein n=1 Tax=Laodelphax striatellus TaxID=195883 RepID=A0A482XD07_LAOST|nr:hypothetical protein LSTR_LSTR001691 [Laodelphax striatellus]